MNMTKDEYLNLVNESEIFKKMDQSMQNVILSAIGDDMAYYLDILNISNNDLQKIKKEAVEEMAKNADMLKDDFKKETRKNMTATENRTRKKEEEESENLINNL